jgi:site-specific recombinase XerD
MTLREKMIHDLELANCASGTVAHYVGSIRAFARFHGRAPEELGSDEVRAWVKHLTRSGLSASRLNQHFCALKFLYRKTLARPEVVTFLSTPKRRRPCSNHRTRRWSRALVVRS